MKFFDRGSDIVVSTDRIEESVSKQEFQAEIDPNGDVRVFGQQGGTQVYLFSDVEEPIEPDVATLIDTLNTWALISLRQKLTTSERLALPNPTAGILPIYDTDLDEPFFYNGNEWITMSTRGVEAFFLAAKGNFGTGGGWADTGFIQLLPVLRFASNLTERAVYMFFALNRIRFVDIDPQVAFIIYSTAAPTAGEAVRWRLTTKYIADTESLGGAASEVILQTQVLTSLTAESRQGVLFFTLDRTLITDQDVIHLNLERLGPDGLDTYGSDIAVGQAGMIVQTNSHNT